jgi:hypothetical protein
MALGTYSTHIFSTYADTQEDGILSGGKRFVLVMADENNGGAAGFYFYDGEELILLNPASGDIPKTSGGYVRLTANDNNELVVTPIN